MDHFTYFFFGIHILFWGFALLAIVYLIFRRLRIKQKEDFGDRDN